MIILGIVFNNHQKKRRKKMAKDMNHVFIIGRLTRDIELKYTTSGLAIGKMSIATNDIKKDAASGNYVDEVSFFNCTLFGKTAENVTKYVAKGHRVAIDGKLKQNRWTDQAGNNQQRVEIVVQNVQFLECNKSKQQSDEMFKGEAETVPFEESLPF